MSHLCCAKEQLTLNQAIEIALENNYSIEIIRKSSEIATNNLSRGNAGMLPRIDAVAGANYQISDIDLQIAAGPQPFDISQDGNVTKVYNTAVELNWTLFDGFAMFINYDKFRSLKERTDIELQIAIESLLTNLFSVYYQTLQLQLNVILIKENIAISQDRLHRVQLQTEFGTALNIEKSKAQLDLNIDSTALLQTELALATMKRNLNFLLSLPIERDYELAAEISFKIIPEFNELLAIAFTKNSSINRAIKDKQISELDFRAVNSLYFPRVSFKSNYAYNLQTADAGFMTKNESKGFNFGLQATMNLFDGFRTNIMSENALVNIKINELKYQQVQSQIELALSNAYDIYQRRLEILELQKINISTAEQNFNRANELFNLGQITSLDFREAQVNLIRSKNAIYDAMYLAKLAESELLLICGIYFE